MPTNHEPFCIASSTVVLSLSGMVSLAAVFDIYSMAEIASTSLVISAVFVCQIPQSVLEELYKIRPRFLRSLVA